MARPAPRGRTEATRAGTLAHVRLALLLVVAVVAPTNPTWALRQGVALAAIAIVLAIGQKGFTGVDVVAGLLGLWAHLSTNWALDYEISALGAQNTVGCVVIFVAFRVTASTKRQVRWLAWAFVIGCWYGVGQLLQEGVRVRFSFDASADRIGIEGLNYNALAYALATSAVLASMLWAAKPRPRPVRAYVVLFGSWSFLYVGVILSGTRGALLAAIALAGWFFLGRRFGAVGLKISLALLVLGQVAVAAGIYDRGLVGFFASDSTRDAGDLSGRLQVWPVARQILLENPLVGIGVDGIQADTRNTMGVAAHNVLLDIASGLGIVGLVLFTWVVFGAFREGLRRPSEAGRLVLGGYALVIFPITLSGFWTQAPVFWISLALVSRVALISPTPDAGDEDAEESSETSSVRRPEGSHLKAKSLR